MRTNPTTFKVEAWLGSVFILLFAAFFVGLFFIFMKNFDSDLAMANDSTFSAYGSPQERIAINEWVKKNKINATSGPNRIHWLILKYPNRPWLD